MTVRSSELCSLHSRSRSYSLLQIDQSDSHWILSPKMIDTSTRFERSVGWSIRVTAPGSTAQRSPLLRGTLHLRGFGGLPSVAALYVGLYASADLEGVLVRRSRGRAVLARRWVWLTKPSSALGDGGKSVIDEDSLGHCKYAPILRRCGVPKHPAMHTVESSFAQRIEPSDAPDSRGIAR